MFVLVLYILFIQFESITRYFNSKFINYSSRQSMYINFDLLTKEQLVEQYRKSNDENLKLRTEIKELKRFNSQISTENEQSKKMSDKDWSDTEMEDKMTTPLLKNSDTLSIN